MAPRREIGLGCAQHTTGFRRYERVTWDLTLAGVDSQVEALKQQLLHHRAQRFVAPGLVAGDGGAQIIVGVERWPAAFDVIGFVRNLNQILQRDAGDRVLRATGRQHAKAAAGEFCRVNGGGFKRGRSVGNRLLRTRCQGREKGDENAITHKSPC